MKICLKQISNMFSCNEYNLIICADGGIGRELRRNLPKCICGDGIKINIIVTGCDGVLQAPALPCNNLVAISSPIKVIRKNPCCNNNTEFASDEFNMDNYNFERDSSCDSCNIDTGVFPEIIGPQEYAIIVRSFNPSISQFLCQYPQMYITDCENTLKLIIIFDKKGSVLVPQFNNNCGCGFGGNCGFGGGCGFGGNCGFDGGCGFGGGCGGFGGGCGCGFGGGCGCGSGLFGIAALALLFCCC